MGNGSTAHLEKRIEALAAEATRRSESRDDEFSALREIVAELGVRAGNLEAALAKQKEPPGLIAIWAPVLSTAIAMGSLTVFVIGQSIAPLEQQATLTEREMDRRYQELNDQVRRIKAKQDTNSENIAGVATDVKHIIDRLDDVDHIGPRRSP